jgi:hypothetical protein
MTGRFDDEVMSVYLQGKEKEAELESQRQDMHLAALETPNPNGFAKTSHSHSNLSNVDTGAYRTQYNTRHALVAKKGESNRERTAKQIHEGKHVSTASLAEVMKESVGKTRPIGYVPPSTESWASTMKHFHAPYDAKVAAEANDRFATHPPRNIRNVLSVDDNEAFMNEELKRSGRHQGLYTTEHSEKFKDRTAEAEVTTKHRTKGVLNLDNGVFRMRHEFHHPRSDVHTGETYKPSQIVPGQFKPMSLEPLHAKE